MEFWAGGGGLGRSRTAPRSLAAEYASFLSRARQLEELGFDGISAPEHHFMYDGFCPAPLVALAAAAARTERLKLVTGALLLPLHDPLRIAESAALLDTLCGGRLVLGLGMGYRPMEFAGLGADKKTRGRRLIEMVRFLVAAFTEPEVSFTGRFYRYERVRLRPRPRQRPHPPVWLCGGTTLAAARRAGRAGLPYWLATATFEQAQTAIAEYRRAGTEAGHPASALRVAVFKDVCLAATEAEARALRDRLLADFYDEHILGFGYLVDENGNHLYNPPRTHPVYRRFVESIFCGTPDGAVEELRRYAAEGVEAVLVATLQRDLFAREVLPHVRSAHT